MTFGSPHRHYRLTDSTNARARELAGAGAPDGMVVTADEQTAGRGRQGRTWTAPAGRALLYSAILRPLNENHLLSLAVPLAVCEAAEELASGVECAIKWPNDVWIEGRKLAGVLIEAHMPGPAALEGAEPRNSWAVIGIGLNLTITRDELPPDLRGTAISLLGATAEGGESPRRCLAKRRPGGLSGAREAGSRFHRPQGGGGHSARRLPPFRAATVLNLHLDRWVTADRDKVLTAWRGRDALRGCEVAWDGGSGVADGIDDRGHLAVALRDGGRVLLGAGDVHLRL